MEHYPEIQRRDGTLFFILPETTPRAAISTSIERLIDLLDALEDDPDLEPYLSGGGDDREGDLDVNEGDDNPDDEPLLGAPERHPSGHWDWTMGKKPRKSDQTQELWSQGIGDELEGNDEGAEDNGDLEPSLGHGGGGYDCELDTADDEPTLGWTDKLDQSAPITHASGIDEGEPDLGWCGHGRGWTANEGHEDMEGNGDEGDHTVGAEDGGWGGTGYDGSGVSIAGDLLSTLPKGLPTLEQRTAAYLATARVALHIGGPN